MHASIKNEIKFYAIQKINVFFLLFLRLFVILRYKGRMTFFIKKYDIV